MLEVRSQPHLSWGLLNCKNHKVIGQCLIFETSNTTYSDSLCATAHANGSKQIPGPNRVSSDTWHQTEPAFGDTSLGCLDVHCKSSQACKTTLLNL